ncbi:MAG: c-type cytochrome [Opitutales bacterium]
MNERPRRWILVCLGCGVLLAGAADSDGAAGREPDGRMADALRTSAGEMAGAGPIESDLERVDYSSCLPCHGEDGRGSRAVFAPPLAGQKRWYLDRQVEHFRLAVRGAHPEDVYGGMMIPMARAVEQTEQRQEVLDEIAEFEPRRPESVLEGDVDLGREIFEERCASCHGDHAEGNREEGAPRLDILPDWYIVRQLRNFQAGFRGELEADEHGRQMRPVALSLTDPQRMEAVAAYIHRQYGKSGGGEVERTSDVR